MLTDVWRSAAGGPLARKAPVSHGRSKQQRRRARTIQILSSQEVEPLGPVPRAAGTPLPKTRAETATG